jgi:phosphopantetheine adenylyltransferase
MKKIEEFIVKHYQKLVLLLLVVILFNTCGNPTKSVNKRIDILSERIDSLGAVTVNKTDLTIEGLKSEKRMIQSTDRKMLDVNRQTEIDKEIETLTK